MSAGEVDPLIFSFSHLADYPRAGDALHTLRRVASLVKPLMRARGWVVRQLTEFYPGQENLLGLNVNRGQKICLRLRYPSDRTLFLPLEEVVDTMLHELAHNVHGPHDGKFHALWNQLRDEHEALAMKGYTGEGFLSQGQRLGGRRIPMDEARRLARASAEKRRGDSGGRGGSGPGKRLGGSAARPERDIRATIADAVARRNRISQGCANDKQSADEIQEIADTATRNGFRTQAEEDAANEAAIAQALWELVQEDEKARLGDAYVPPTVDVPREGGALRRGTLGRQKPAQPKPSLSTSQRGSDSAPTTSRRTASSRAANAGASTTWSCAICTLSNPAIYLCCDACGAERQIAVGSNGHEKPTSTTNNNNAKRKWPETIDLTQTDGDPRGGSSTGRVSGSSSSSSASARGSRDQRLQGSTAPQPKLPPPSRQKTWTCSDCGRVRERQWWSCDLCGKIKDSSA
ncbi:WLM domain-domain-containing protein [Microdochium bolleyi]|uniref:WLM domain-domain-containing protein n=1 Tax=Microdochium bolleyi TaxID=196109 RepID=A0A136J2B2_9PEZI|nr:WLM domain-domain-containing protein [Microdochium bolleyi]